MSSTKKKYLKGPLEKKLKLVSLLGSITEDQKPFNQISTVEKEFLESIIEKEVYTHPWVEK